MELETDFPDAFRHFLSEAGIQFEDEEDVSFDKTFDHAIEPSINDSDASDQQGAGVNGCFDSFDIEGITTLWSIERTDSVGGSELGMCGQSMGPSSEAREAPHQAGDIVGVTQHFGLFLDSVVDPIDVNSQKDALEGSEWLQMYEDNTSAGEAHQENSISEPVFAASPVVEALSGPDLLEAELGGEDWNKHMAAGGPPAGTSWETPPSLEAAGPSSGATAGCLTGGSRSSASVASQSHIDKPKPAKDSTSTKRRRREAWQLHKSKQAKTTRRNGLGTGRGRYEESVAGADHHGAQQGPMGAKQGPMGTKPGPEECERSPTRCTSPQSEVSSQDVAARTGQHGEDAPDPDGDEGSSDRDLDEVTRKQKRLIRNRESACQSRLRRKSYMADMEGKCAFLESQVKHLQQAASLQIMENAHLRQELARVQHLFGHAVAPAPPPPGGAPVPPGAPAGGNAEPKTRTKTKTHARTSGQKKGGKSGSVAEPAVLESELIGGLNGGLKISTRVALCCRSREVASPLGEGLVGLWTTRRRHSARGKLFTTGCR
eukprot:jgi/Mesen1/1079/ME000123S00246